MTWAKRITLVAILQSYVAGVGGSSDGTIAGSVQSMTIRRGREKGTERMTVGTCSLRMVLRASNGEWTARNAAGDPLWLGSNLMVRATADSGTTRGLFWGTVRSLSDEFDTAGRLIISIQAVDRLGALAQVVPDPDELSIVQDVPARLSYINALAPGSTYSAGATENLGAATATQVQATHMTRNLLDEAMLAAESDNGELWAGRDAGTALTYRDRAAFEAISYFVTEQLAWANVAIVNSVWDTGLWDTAKWGTEAANVAGTTTFSTATDTEEVVNRVSLNRVGGTAVTYSASEGVYGRRTYERTDLIPTTDEPLRARALWLLKQGATRTHRVDKLTTMLDPAASQAMLDALLNIDLHARHRLVWDDGSGNLYDFDGHVQGLEHTVTPDTWKVAVNLWQYT